VLIFKRDISWLMIGFFGGNCPDGLFIFVPHFVHIDIKSISACFKKAAVGIPNQQRGAIEKAPVKYFAPAFGERRFAFENCR